MAIPDCRLALASVGSRRLGSHSLIPCGSPEVAHLDLRVYRSSSAGQLSAHVFSCSGRPPGLLPVESLQHMT